MRIRVVAGGTVAGAGALLLVATGVYYAYGVVATASLDQLSYSAERPSIAGPEIESRPAGHGEMAMVDGGAPSGEVVDSAAHEAAMAAPIGAPESEETTLKPLVEISLVKIQEPARLPDPGALAHDVVAIAEPAGAQTGGGEAQVPTRDSEVEGESDLRPDVGQLAMPAEADGSLAGPSGNGAAATSQGLNAGAAAGGETDAASPERSSETLQAAYVFEQTGPNFVDQGPQPFLRSTEEVSRAKVDLAEYASPSSVELSGDLLPATRILIPAVRVDSDVSELRVDYGSEEYAWETPQWVVGHIPTTAGPGDQGQGWYFGHLESLIRGEGNVFQTLPQVPQLLSSGESVYVVLEAPDRKYLYEVYRTEVVHQDDLKITDSGKQDITLVTCVPRFVYDHRLLVTAALVGVSES